MVSPCISKKELIRQTLSYLEINLFRGDWLEHSYLILSIRRHLLLILCMAK